MNKSKLNKKVMLFSILLVFVICLGCASASENIDDNNTDEVLTTPTEDVGTDDTVLAAENMGSNNTVKATGGDELLGEDSGTGSFSDLNLLIKSTEAGGTLTLDRNFNYNNAVCKI